MCMQNEIIKENVIYLLLSYMPKLAVKVDCFQM